MGTPLVSLLLPTARRPQWVYQVLRMIDAQTYKGPFEVVIVNSGEPFGYLPKYAREVRAKKKGFPEQNGQSILEAQGDIMIFMDDDDYYAPTRVERQVEPILAGRVAMTGTKMYYYVEVPAMRWWYHPPATPVPPGSPPGWQVPFFEGSACFDRCVLSHFTTAELTRIWRTPFINKLKDAGVKYEIIPNQNAIIRVQHTEGSSGDANCYARDFSKWIKTTEPVGEIPQYVTDFWKRGGK